MEGVHFGAFGPRVPSFQLLGRVRAESGPGNMDEILYDGWQ